ncbi:MAG: hypothetical protein JJE27_08590, partial [Thermoleophilia bacterium]|nr:hypothetical protein [Thermoleophilia bacterium]
EAIDAEGPVLVDVRVTREENTYPMIPAGQAARDMVTDKSELGDAFKEAIDAEGPVLVDVRVTREENTYPMIPAGQAARDMVG